MIVDGRVKLMFFTINKFSDLLYFSCAKSMFYFLFLKSVICLINYLHQVFP